jgi:hypothetical protein
MWLYCVSADKVYGLVVGRPNKKWAERAPIRLIPLRALAIVKKDLLRDGVGVGIPVKRPNG